MFSEERQALTISPCFSEYLSQRAERRCNIGWTETLLQLLGCQQISEEDEEDKPLARVIAISKPDIQDNIDKLIEFLRCEVMGLSRRSDNRAKHPLHPLYRFGPLETIKLDKTMEQNPFIKHLPKTRPNTTARPTRTDNQPHKRTLFHLLQHSLDEHGRNVALRSVQDLPREQQVALQSV